MKTIVLQLVFGLICTNLLNLCDGQRTKDKMYERIDGFSACFRRMNATHQIGCTTERGGSTGVVHMIAAESDLDVILKANNGLRYIPVLPVELFSKTIADKLQAAEHISGLVVYGSNETDFNQTSHEDTCPNRYSNTRGTCRTNWNEYGTAMLQMDFNFAAFYINRDDQIEKIKDCYHKFNSFDFDRQAERSLCSLELEGFMFASIDTPTCMRRSGASFNLNPVKFCDPLGDMNVWGSLFPVGNSSLTPEDLQPDMKYIILAARIDTTSLFSDLTPGADNPVTSLVTLLTTAMKLKKMIPSYKTSYNRNVLFVLFNGESYDYIGSQRFVYEMENGLFPGKDYRGQNESISSIRPENVELYIEVNQMSKTDFVYLYSMEHNHEVTEFVTRLKKYAGNLTLNETVGKIPPASYHSFFRANHTVPGVIMTDHGDHYANLFYNSQFDDAGKINFNYVNVSDSSEYHSPQGSIQEHVDDVSSAIAKSLYEGITNQKYDEDQPKVDGGYLVNELFHCYLENANCLVHKAIQRKEFRSAPLSLYVGVSVSQNTLTTLIGLTMAWLTGTIVSPEPCNITATSYVYRHFNMSESLDNLNVTNCFQSSMNVTIAESPAFLIEDYDWSSGNYSSWSESVWRDIRMRIFLKPARGHEIMTFSVGSVVFILSIITVLFLKRKSDVLFDASTLSPASC